MQEFKYQETVEGWVEGLFDLVDTYMRTVLRMTFHPRRSFASLATSDQIPEGTSRPSVYFVLSYLVMCLLIVRVDFADPFFSFNLAELINALGVLTAAKSMKPELLVEAIVPSIALLFVFTYISGAVMGWLRDPMPRLALRRMYSYMFGGFFLWIGVGAVGYHLWVKPALRFSWWVGLPVHVATMMFGSILMIVPLLAVQHYTDARGQRGRPVVRTIAFLLPVAVAFMLLRWIGGSFYLMDYMRLRHAGG